MDKIYCVVCGKLHQNVASFIYHGDSLCKEHYKQIREADKKLENKRIGFGS